MLSVLLYPAETRTLFSADSRALEAFHVKCEKQPLQIKWHQFVWNDDISESTGLTPISESISHRCNSLFSHVARLQEDAFQLTTATLTYRSDVHQVANETVAQAVLATDGLTRFGGTTTSRPPTFGVWGRAVSRGHRVATLRLLPAKR